MQRFLIGAIVSCVPSLLAAQTTSVASDLERMERASWVAWQHHDGKFFANFLSDDHVEIGGSGVSGKQDVVKFVASGVCVVNSYSLDSFKVTRFAPDVAVVTYHATQDTKCGGQVVPSPAWVTSTFVRRNGKWRDAIYQQTAATHR